MRGKPKRDRLPLSRRGPAVSTEENVAGRSESTEDPKVASVSEAAPANECSRADLPGISAVAGSSEEFQNGRMAMDCCRQRLLVLAVHHRRGDSHPRSLGRNTGLSILGHLPSNDLIRLQFDSSTGICVPNLVPDGLHQARQWPQVEDGGPDWRIPHGPQEVSSGGHRLHDAGSGIKLGQGSGRPSRRGDRRELTTIR